MDKEEMIMAVIYAAHMNSYHGFSFEEALQSAAKAGCKYVELAAVRNWTEHIMADMTAEEKQAAKDLLAKYGMTPIGLSGHANLMDPSSLEYFTTNIRLAAEFGCRYIITSCGEAHFGENEVFTNEGLINNIRSLVPVLEETGVRLALELHGEHGSSETMVPIIRGGGSPAVGIAFDTANCYFYGGVQPEEDLDNCLDEVIYVHLKDHAGEQKLWNFPGLGNGELNLKAFLDKLTAHGFDGACAVEIEYTEDFTMRDKVPGDIAVADKEMADSYNYLKALGRVE